MKPREKINSNKPTHVTDNLGTVHYHDTLKYSLFIISNSFRSIDRFHSRGQGLCKFLGAKQGFYMRKAFNPHRIFLVH